MCGSEEFNQNRSQDQETPQIFNYTLQYLHFARKYQRYPPSEPAPLGSGDV